MSDGLGFNGSWYMKERGQDDGAALDLWEALNKICGTHRAFKREGALYPDGAHITDLKEVRSLLYKMQRPAIAPKLVYPHDWREKDFVLFHNRGVLHTVVGAFTKGEVCAFHQCNLAASSDPVGPGARQR
ncbi:hypothetical protein Hypma_011355 [Hypsizygus marmoreus]|uniref:TauD/TfdA-like domain-containing protein n=1 Tax=Hypsizygus marmoreus TaxID=39966 RepID=A0A369JQ63_HYPMA|nr:hypothetical protein Hypma_011355 [Hypsizygus marmoreus]